MSFYTFLFSTIILVVAIIFFKGVLTNFLNIINTASRSAEKSALLVEHKLDTYITCNYQPSGHSPDEVLEALREGKPL